MNNNFPIVRVVPRWVHVLSIITAVLTVVGIFVLGGMVTTYQAGMADPVWPTPPWYLFFISWKNADFPFLIEHLHRLAGFAVGGFASLLAICVWAYDPRKTVRWLGIGGLIGLLGVFGMFHGQMMKQIDAEVIQWPWPTIFTMIGIFVGLMVLGISGIFQGVKGSSLRTLVVVGLVAVMFQGLLGGLRVRLNSEFGNILKAVHGANAQIVFCFLLSLVFLTAPRNPQRPIDSNRSRLMWLSLGLVAVDLLQLVWGVWVRHLPNLMAQRLHFLTAFLVVGFSIIFIVQATRSNQWSSYRFPCILLSVFLFLQVALGVEAWLGKFGPGISLDEKIPLGKAIVRTLHVLVGLGILGTGTTLAFLVGFRKSDSSAPQRMAFDSAGMEAETSPRRQSTMETPERVGGTA